MSDAKPFPLNAWYAAAWSHEIKHELVVEIRHLVPCFRALSGEDAGVSNVC